MRKRKTMKLDEREVTVKELTVEEILSLQDLASGGIEDLSGLAAKVLPMCIEGIDLEALKKCAPSELEGLAETFKDVNAAFFRVARWAGLDRMAENVKSAVVNDFLSSLAGSSPPGTSQSGDTDTAPSSGPPDARPG